MKRELKTNNKIQLRIRIAIILFLSVLPQNKLFLYGASIVFIVQWCERLGERFAGNAVVVALAVLHQDKQDQPHSSQFKAFSLN